DGIRDRNVTGVQTCALPIFAHGVEAHHDALGLVAELARHLGDAGGVVGDGTEGVLRHDDPGRGQHAHAGEGHEVERELDVALARSEERRVGKEWRWRGWGWV